jgi:hypothetical protein
MHDLDRTTLESSGFETGEFTFENQELPGGTFGEGPFNENEMNELATELMMVQSEEELEQFLGSLIKKAGRAVGSFVKGPIGSALGGVLKTVAKKALPFAGGALGSLIPIPGVGTMIGRAAGSALAGALETENLEGEEQEMEVARRFVQIAGTAAQQAASAPPNMNPQAAAMRAVRTAMQQTGGFGRAGGAAGGAAAAGGGAGAAGAGGGRTGGGSHNGRWFRRGHKIILVGV